MTTLARKHISARIYAIGGFGIKTVSSFLASTDPRSVQHVDFSFLDTSGSDLSAGLKPEEVYLFRNMDGGGKDPRNTYKQVLPYLDDLLEKHAPADFNIVVHSSSGGSGSSVGRALVSRLLKDGENVVVLQVGSVASKKEVENTIGTIKSYATFSSMYQRPVVSYYRENNESTSRRLVDDHIRSALYLLTLIFSAENRGLDTADLTNLLDYNKVTSFEPCLTNIDFFHNEVKLPESLIPQAMVCLFGDEEPEHSKIVPVEYLTDGFLSEERIAAFGKNLPVYGVLFSGDFAARLEQLEERLKVFQNAERTRSMQIKNVEVVADADDGMVF